jgi:RNA polymerase sigma factor (sigma-70 family)
MNDYHDFHRASSVRLAAVPQLTTERSTKARVLFDGTVLERPGRSAASRFRAGAAMGTIAAVDEAALLEAWRAGDRRAGAAIVERHFDSLYQFFRSKTNGDVDDLVQQTFVSCLEARETFRGECSFRTLLFRIARRRLYDHYRALRRVRALDFTTTSVRALGTSPSGALVRRDEGALLRDALQELPVESQILLELHYWEGLSTEELALVFEVSVGTIKSRQFTARARLRALLSARGFGESGAGEGSAPSPVAQGAYMQTQRLGSATDCDPNQARSTSSGGTPTS